MIFAAISLSEGRPQYGILSQMLGTGTVVTVANASIALAIVSIAWVNPAAAWVLLVPAAVLFVGYRAYTSITQRHKGLEFLYEAIRTFHRSPHPGEEAILELLSQTRRMFRAEVAEVIFLPSPEHEQMTRTSLGPEDQVSVMEPFELDVRDDLVERATAEGKSILAPRAQHGRHGGGSIGSRNLRDVMIAPIPGQSGVVGALLIGNRLGDVSTFGNDDLQLLETLAQHLGVSLESARAGILQEAVTQLTEINQMKDDLIASTSHELRTPLTSIQGFVKTLLRPDVHFTIDEQRSFLETVARQSERLTNLVEDLLMASRLESERGGIEPAPVSLAGVAMRIVDEVAPQAGGRSLRIEIDHTVPTIETDGERVHQILLNLVVNAIKYSPDGSTITIGARTENDGVVLCVEDQGEGIPQELHEKVFDRFYQVDQSSTRAAGGVGLGLYICRRLADTLGGRLWLQRSDERGSIFSVWIPRTPPARTTGVPEAHAVTG
jgi:two-component system phosphate regulon sensor histidine kinase PhoR